MFTRRHLLRSAAAVPIAAATNFFPGVVPGAYGVEPVTIAAIVTVTSTVISMFNKSNALARELAALNAKLDTVIDLQLSTIQGMERISSQIDDLSIGLDQALINQTMRESLGEARGLLAGLEQKTTRFQSDGSLSESHLNELNSDFIEAECDRAVTICSNLRGHLESSGASGERGLDTVRFAMLTTFVAHSFVPTFVLLDSELVARGVEPKSRTVRYEAITKALQGACQLIAQQHGPSQVSFQTTQLNSLLADPLMQQWSREISFPQSSQNFRFTERFMNHQAFGPCTHGNNFNEDATAIFYTSIPFGGNRYWSNYRFESDVEISGTSAVVDSVVYGVSDMTWRILRFDRIHSGDFDPRTSWGPRQNVVQGHPRLPMTFRQYYCPGMPLHDRPNWSYALLRDHYIPELNRQLASFKSIVQKQTERRLNILGLQKTIDWCASTGGMLDESLQILAES